MGREWAWWRYDFRNTGHTPDQGPVDSVRSRWQYDAGYGIPGTPVFADETVNVATMNPHFEPNLHGIRADTGTRRYATPDDDPLVELRGSPTVADGIAYVLCLDHAPLVRGYDVDTGERVCGYDVAPLGKDGIPPVLADEMLYCVSDWTVTAVDPDTGIEAWSFSPGETFGAAALVDGTLIVGGADPNTDGPPIRTGNEEWPKARVQYPSLYALDSETGAVDWTLDLEIVPRTVAVEDGLVFCCGSEPYSRFTTIDSPVGLTDGGLSSYGMVHAASIDGQMQWTAELDAPIRGGPAVANGMVLVGTDEGDGNDAESVVAFDAVTGERQWTHSGDGRWTTPSVGDGVVYAGNRAGYVDALVLADGSHLWRFETSGGIDGPPSISGGRVYVGDSAGIVYALEERR